MAVEYLDVSGITEAARYFQTNINEFDKCVINMNNATNRVLRNWAGEGRTQFERQMMLMKMQLDDISQGLYDLYHALLDAESSYIDEDEAVAKQFSIER